MKIKVVFFSAGKIALPCLEYLSKCTEIELVGIVTLPERPKGRGQKVSLNPIAQWAEQQKIPYCQAHKMDDSVLNWLKGKDFSLGFTMAFGHFLKPDFLTLPPLGMWNFHTSLLPKYRGASPIATCLLDGAQETGVSLMSMVSELDAGPWIAQKKIAIEENETSSSLSTKLAEESVQLLKENLSSIIKKTYILNQQNEKEVTFTHKFNKADGLLDFSKPAIALERQIRAFYPWPSSYFFLKNQRYIVHKAHIESEQNNAVVGTINIDSVKGIFSIQTTEGILAIDVIQKAGGKPLTTKEFLRGTQLENAFI